MPNKIEVDLLHEQIKHAALRKLEEIMAKHLKNEFYNKMLPKVIEQLQRSLVVECLEDYDCFEIKIKLKPTEEK